MSRLIDADALIDDVTERYCKDCEKRKGMKNGKRQFVYEIGEVPCRACDVDYMKFDIDNAPTVDAVPVVRCKDCKRCDTDTAHHKYFCMRYGMDIPGNWFCADGEKEKV